ncbi:RNA polymerase sigma-70 factor (ECF subfamily) [Aneurinibacillus soli]|uniref:ECF RNA polymerase sigma factor SigW n=1 Tax=Aneurinibacillus soli TaxID=1500254 RepID=A0A0U5BFU5_9BACL|nr:sigma-70 family RNA polymerase sigma factor [Aneurinibacillus soli]PYE59511.1 RNA polymerase sigma-70 factor (ECF subfamily) [Aneurinibacillus soli]BAU29159.1 ECF RNA polymerase sigma factor SigW [Aneurinibacillus soli]
MDHELYGLIGRASQGEQEAFVQLINRYKGAVFRQAYAMLHDRMEAEDVSQEAFLKVYSSLAKLEQAYAFVPWLAQIVSRLCYDRIRKKKRENTFIEEDIEKQIFFTQAPSSVEQKHVQLNIEEAMQKLSPEHRMAITLRDIQGFSYDEMAEILKIPVGTVKSRIHAARLALRKELTE